MDLPLTLGDPEISLEQKIDNSLRIGNEHFVNVSSGQFDVDVLLSVCRGIPRKRATFKNRVLNIEEYHWDVHRERLQKISEVENKLVGGNGFTTTCYGYVEKEDSKFHVMRCTEDAIVTLDHVLDTEAQTFKTWCKNLWK
ncbi:hypothetical protein QR680_003729 [Steinernema hermaphroditum]|uniref:Uncharacterized protein n=1 Tax=Steinernema hermaphroditum TaxID=289476 RepID=A0AA39HLD0_9BILA|nr:hypothetical protein QR680_003729 [Steinernema hermaphroditum]